MITLLSEYMEFLEQFMYFFSVGEQKWNTEEAENISRNEIIMKFLEWKLEK